MYINRDHPKINWDTTVNSTKKITPQLAGMAAGIAITALASRRVNVLTNVYTKTASLMQKTGYTSLFKNFSSPQVFGHTPLQYAPILNPKGLLPGGKTERHVKLLGNLLGVAAGAIVETALKTMIGDNEANKSSIQREFNDIANHVGLVYENLSKDCQKIKTIVNSKTEDIHKKIDELEVDSQLKTDLHEQLNELDQNLMSTIEDINKPFELGPLLKNDKKNESKDFFTSLTEKSIETLVNILPGAGIETINSILSEAAPLVRTAARLGLAVPLFALPSLLSHATNSSLTQEELKTMYNDLKAKTGLNASPAENAKSNQPSVFTREMIFQTASNTIKEGLIGLTKGSMLGSALAETTGKATILPFNPNVLEDSAKQQNDTIRGEISTYCKAQEDIVSTLKTTTLTYLDEFQAEISSLVKNKKAQSG